MIQVTKTFLPPFEEYTAILKTSWDNGWITNNGVLLQQLEQQLKTYLNLKHLLVCANGTIVLQMALKVLEISGDVITTPFSYVATTTAILWENCKPVFVDINPVDFCIDAAKIEAAITPDTRAILATHVYGMPCDVEVIAQIAQKYNLKVIYDAAHAFGTSFKNQSLLDYGDISTCSFHATKLFHTGEGGCLVTRDDVLAEKLFLFRQFGHIGDAYHTIGINAKNSEFHAALGLCNLRYIPSILEKQKQKWLLYQSLLQDTQLQTLHIGPNVGYNYAYFPVVFSSETRLLEAVSCLNRFEIFPRRYFFPALNKLPYVVNQPCPVAEHIARCVLCLPLYADLPDECIRQIVQILSDLELTESNTKR